MPHSHHPRYHPLTRYWPELDVARGILPRRAFLVAKHAVPANVELTWDYGRHYERHWLAKRGRARGGAPSAALRVAGGGGEAEEDEAEGYELGGLGGGGGGGVGVLQEGAAMGEAREQMLAAEELLPWGAVNPSWGARRYDWLARLHGAADAAPLLAMPMHEFEAELRPWALGKAAGKEMPPALPDDSVPSASLDHRKAQAAPTHPGAQPEPLGDLPVASVARLGPTQK